MKTLPPFTPPQTQDDRFDSIDPLDNRYFDPEIASFLSERTRITYQAYVEGALAQTLAEFDICTQEIADEIIQAARQIDVVAVAEEEKTTKHDVKAIVNTIKSKVSDQAQPFVHFGATSYDIVSNASALQFRATTNKLVIPRIEQLMATLCSLAETYVETIQIGRTHGQHAVPITFGFAIAEYISRLGQNKDKLLALSNELRGKFSGAVGAYNALSLFVDDPLEFEKRFLELLELKPAEYSTQLVPPEATIRLLEELTLSAGIMANLSHDMRHLQRSEIAEVRERFEEGQTGSSTMAHKRNPWNFENVISMSKQVSAQMVNANQNIASEHQRDLTDSASARFYPLSFAMVAAMTKRLDTVMGKIEIDKRKMDENLQLTDGAIAAEPLYLLLEKHGHTRAHETSKAVAHEALKKGVRLDSLLPDHPEIGQYWKSFSDSERAVISNPEKYYVGLAAKKTRDTLKRWQ